MGYRVMVVEDEAVVAAGLSAMIGEAGHETIGIARTAEEAIEMAQHESIDAAVVDIKLPGASGIEAAKRLVCDNTAVVVLTAYSDPELIEGAAAAGVSAYLLKPTSKEILCANINVAVARVAESTRIKKEADDLKLALETRKLSERAKHVLMARLGQSEADAHAHLRQKCRNQNKTMTETSEEILAADKMFMAAVDSEAPKKTESAGK